MIVLWPERGKARGRKGGKGRKEEEENRKKAEGKRGKRMVAKHAPVNTHIPIATGSWLGPEVWGQPSSST